MEQIIERLQLEKDKLADLDDTVLVTKQAFVEAEKDFFEALRQRDMQVMRIGILIDQLTN